MRRRIRLRRRVSRRVGGRRTYSRRRMSRRRGGMRAIRVGYRL